MHRMDLAIQCKGSTVLYNIINIIFRVMFRLINSSLIGFCCWSFPNHDVRNDSVNVSKMGLREASILLPETECPTALILSDFNFKSLAGDALEEAPQCLDSQIWPADEFQSGSFVTLGQFILPGFLGTLGFCASGGLSLKSGNMREMNVSSTRSPTGLLVGVLFRFFLSS